MSVLKPGVSVIVPSYKGVDFLPRVLSSLLRQSLDSKLFEVLVVLNGPDDGSQAYLEEYRTDFPELNLKVLESSVSGASRARNIGLSSVTHEYVTFLDVDDELEEEYLSKAFDLVENDTCVLLPIVDIVKGERVDGNSLNIRISALAGSTQLVRSHAWILGFNACKIIPTQILKNFRYPEHLNSGEDVAFFAQLLQIPDLKVTVPSKSHLGAYLRHFRDDSVSRQNKSFEFNVRQRLECISAIASVNVRQDAEKARDSLVNSQFSIVDDYLTNHPDEAESATEAAISLRVTGLNFSKYRLKQAKRLVISYCFPPYSDTSAIVAAKQVVVEEELVDVISATMDRVRTVDNSTELIAAKYIRHHELLRVDPSFSSWPLISSFAAGAVRAATRMQKKNGGYESMYSRALWSGSHVGAALVKSKFPSIYWEAEFSDPLRQGVNGSPRQGRITWGTTTRRLRKVISQSSWPDLIVNTHFDLTEAATLVSADRLIFTNIFQQDAMLDGYPVSLQDFAREKSLIRPHAQPGAELFDLGRAEYRLDDSKVNVGYFGNFYKNRGIGPVLDAVDGLSEEDRKRLAFHIFCNKPEEVERAKYLSGLDTEVHARNYLPYLDFLSVLNKFDVLLVNDVELEGTLYKNNPFLPSKYADYTASDAAIWGIVTPGSALSQMPMHFQSSLTEPETIGRELYRMLEELG